MTDSPAAVAAGSTPPAQSVLSIADAPSESPKTGPRGRGERRKSITAEMLKDIPMTTGAKVGDQDTLDQRVQKNLEERENNHGSFKSKKRTSIQGTKAQLQALQSRAKKDALAHAQATAVQAQILAEERMNDRATPAAHKSMSREKRLSLGLDAGLAFETLTAVWAAQGTTDDLVRPENNAMGCVIEGDREMISRVLANSDMRRVEQLLRKYIDPTPGNRTPTTPSSPRPGLSSTPKGMRRMVNYRGQESPVRITVQGVNAVVGVKSTAGYVVPSISTSPACRATAEP